MKELERILREHAARYPRMEPTDAVKLIYQSEFGGGHLIKDAQACLDYLRREYGATTKDPAVPLYEPIGNGIVRVNLAALSESSLDALGKAFIVSAAEHKGDLGRFLKKLDILRALTAEGIFSFDGNSLTSYLDGYEKAGYPAVSHSSQYRACYRPAYRIILARYLPQL